MRSSWLGSVAMAAVLVSASACGGKTASGEVQMSREAWLESLAIATARALQMGDLEALHPFLPTGRDCGITSQVDAYQLGRWTCAVSKLDEGFTKPFFESVKALNRRQIIGTKATWRIGVDPDADPQAREWQRRLEYVYPTPDMRVGVFWTVAEFEGRYLLVGPPVVGKPSM